MNVNQEVRLNLSADGIPPRLFMPQGDANSRTIVATLWDGATPYNVPASTAVMVRFRKPDGTGGLYDATEAGTAVIASGNTVTAPVATQMLAVAGVVQAEIDIYGTGSGKAADRLATFRFAVEVAPSVYTDAQIISSDYFNIIADDIAKAVSAAIKAEEAENGAVAAKTAAEGYAMEANASEESANASETAAAESASAAAESASAAQQSATSAAESAAVYDDVVADINQLKQDLMEISESGNQLFDNKKPNIAISSTEYFFITGGGDIDTASLTSGNPRLISISIKPNTTYTIKKSTATHMRVGTYISSVTTKQHATSYAVHSNASSDPLTVTSGADDRYLGVHLFSDSDSIDLKTIEANISSLIIVEGNKIPKDIYNKTAVDYVARQNGKNSNIVILSDYATGDGVTDDTSAIKTALENARGKTLYVPSGTYLFSKTLTIGNGTHVVGCGSSSVFKLANSFTLTPYSWRPSLGDKYNYRYPMIRTESDGNGCILENFALIGQTSSFIDENEDGLCVSGNNHIVRNVIATDINYFPSEFSGRNCITPAYGINIIDASNVIVENCTVERCGYEGIGTERASNITVINCKCGICNQTGLQVHASSKAVRFQNCEVTMTNRPSITLDSNTDVEMEDIIIDGCSCGKGVVFVAGGERNITLSNNRFRDGISCNNGEYRDKIKIVNNTIGGRVDVYCDNAIYCNNAVGIDNGYYYIIARGNNCIVANNIGTGTVKDTTIITHE